MQSASMQAEKTKQWDEKIKEGFVDVVANVSLREGEDFCCWGKARKGVPGRGFSEERNLVLLPYFI